MTERRAWVLETAAWLAMAETAALILVLSLGGAPLAPFVIGALLLKFPFCWLARQLRPGALMGVFLWELGGVLAALQADAHAALRIGELVVAATVIALLIASIPLFPPVRLPEPE